MSWLITNKSGKMVGVEQASMEKPDDGLRPRGDNAVWDKEEWQDTLKAYNVHISSLRELPAEGFDESDVGKIIADEDVEVVYQVSFSKAERWIDCNKERYDNWIKKYNEKRRRIILRKKQPVKQGEQDEMWLEFIQSIREDMILGNTCEEVVSIYKPKYELKRLWPMPVLKNKGLPKACKDKDRKKDEPCKYPIGTCEYCKNNF